jgi:uncharacterized membrane protein
MAGASRYYEIDMVRGIAILMMILFHTLFDLNYFQIFPVDIYEGFWKYFAYSTASLFLIVVGISLIISRGRAQLKYSGHQLALKYVYRGAGIFLLGLLVTVVTWWYLGEGFVVFGILQLIGVSVMLSPLFFRFKTANIVLGLLFIVIGYLLSATSGPAWLIPLGIHPPNFWSVDYEPVFPWTGVVLIGMGLGEYLFPGGIRRFTPPVLPRVLVRPLSFLGRHSLVVYLVHQPVIILLLAVVFGVNIL